MFDEERLDPHGVGNLPHFLTIKNKSSTFGVRGRVEQAHFLVPAAYALACERERPRRPTEN